jgi:hypothetical protein
LLRRICACAVRIVPLAVALGLTWAVPAASGQVVGAEASASPAVWRFGATRVVAYDIRLTAGPNPTGAIVSYDVPDYETAGGDRREPIGSPLAELEPRVLGPGELEGRARLPYGDTGRDLCFRGRDQRYNAVSVSQPPNTTSTLRLRFRLFPPLRDLDYALPIIVRSGQNTFRLRAEPPRIAGPVGVRLKLGSRPGSFPFGAAKVGQSVLLTGRTSRRLMGRKIALRLASGARSVEQLISKRPPFGTLARVAVDGRGRFSFRWRPETPGWTELRAVYPGDRRTVRTESCPRRIYVSADGNGFD